MSGYKEENVSKLLTLQAVMDLLGVSRATATRIINEAGAALPRRKGQAYLVNESKLLRYVEGERK